MKSIVVWIALSILPVAAVAQPQFTAPRHVQPAEWPQPAAETLATFDQLVAAIVTNDFEAFTALLDDDFKQALTRRLFEEVCAHHGTRFKSGCEIVYAGEVKQSRYTISLWRMSFADGGDQTLATLSLKDGKVGGFYLG